MKFSTQEEYGLRFLIRIAYATVNNKKSLTIPEISDIEGIPEHTVAKVLRVLRINGYLKSERGKQGGYTLAKAPNEIVISNVITSLGGKLFDDDYCIAHSQKKDLICTSSVECSVRSLWKAIQNSIDKVAESLTLENLINSNANN